MWITESNLTDTNQLEYGLLELILSPNNLNEANVQVKRNRGRGGVDKMEVESLKDDQTTWLFCVKANEVQRE